MGTITFAYFLCLIIFWRKINTRLFPQPLKPWVSSQAFQLGSSCISDFGFLSLPLICEVCHHHAFQCFLSLESQISVSIPSPLGFNFLLLPLSLKLYHCRSPRTLYLNILSSGYLCSFKLLIFLWNFRYLPTWLPKLTWTFILSTLLGSRKLSDWFRWAVLDRTSSPSKWGSPPDGNRRFLFLCFSRPLKVAV